MANANDDKLDTSTELKGETQMYYHGDETRIYNQGRSKLYRRASH